MSTRALADSQRPQQKAAITAAILKRLLATCDSTLYGVRDRALLLVGMMSGGRRRDELVQLKVSDLHKTETDYQLTLRKSKTDQTGLGHTVPIEGEAATTLTAWFMQSGIRHGRLVRSIKRNGQLNDAIVKIRIECIGLDPTEYGAHSLRAGFITE